MKYFLTISIAGLFISCGQQTDTTPTGTTSASAKDMAVNTAASHNNDSSYSNHRYLYYLEYPGALLVAQPESANGDGKVFLNHAGDEILRTWGGRNEDVEGRPVTLQQAYNDALKDWATADSSSGNLSYRKLGNDFFVLSGIRNGKIIYEKTIAKQDAFATITLQYDSKDSITYKAATEAISRSFHFLKDDQTGQYYPNSY